MELEELKYLIENYTEDLPGWNAQKLLSPPYRENYDLEFVKTMNPKTAAVLIMLYEKPDGDIAFPIIMRVMYEGVHSNQFSLPGGQFEELDVNVVNTAIRETSEELGVDEENIEIIKQLSEIYIPPSNFLVYPFIGYHYGEPDFFPEEAEVQYILPLDLYDFLEAEPSNFEREFSGNVVEIPGYELGDGDYLWGATAMILEEFKAIVLDILAQEENLD